MNIQKISFTASLLNNVQATKQNEQTMGITSTQSDKNISAKPEKSQFFEENQSQIDNYKKYSSVKNIALVLSAATVLIGLGVAGRKGYLGKGIQKILGGTATKSAEHSVSDAIDSDIQNLISITKSEAAAIDAKLDRTMPKIEPKMLKFKAPSIKDLEMGFDLSTFEMTAEPNAEKVIVRGRKKYFLQYNNNGELNYIYQGTKNVNEYFNTTRRIHIEKEKIISFKNRSKNMESYYNNDSIEYSCVEPLNLNYNSYYYNKHGLLDRITVQDKGYNVIKDIEYIPGQNKVQKITYGNYCTFPELAQKVEIYDGLPNPSIGIYIKDGEQVTRIVD